MKQMTTVLVAALVGGLLVIAGAQAATEDHLDGSAHVGQGGPQAGG